MESVHPLARPANAHAGSRCGRFHGEVGSDQVQALADTMQSEASVGAR
jgi:hypothetical protein